MKNIIRIALFFIFLFVLQFSFAQHQCSMEESHGNMKGNPPTCDINVNQTSVKTIRVTVHVFQKNNGTGNIPNNTTGKNWIKNVISSASSQMGNLQPMNLNTNSPYIKDSKIRFKLMNTYYWKNTTMWAKAKNTNTNGKALYNYIKSKGVSYKYNSIHIFIPGDDPGTTKLGGIACGFGCDDWTMLQNVYRRYVQNKPWEVRGLVKHELGHNLSLYHTWYNDGLADTPSNSNCWNGSSCSNNVMDYNACQCALTLDQVSKMHVWLNSHPTVIYSGKEYGNLSGYISSSGYQGKMYGSTANIRATNGTVTFSAPGVSSFSWSKTGGNGYYSTNNNGKTLNLSGLGSINLRVTWKENCSTYTRNLAFYKSYYLWDITPNPATDFISIQPAAENELQRSGKVGQSTAPVSIGSLTVHNVSGQQVMQRDQITQGNFQLDISELPAGVYYLRLYSDGDHQLKKFIKM